MRCSTAMMLSTSFAIFCLIRLLYWQYCAKNVYTHYSFELEPDGKASFLKHDVRFRTRIEATLITTWCSALHPFVHGEPMFEMGRQEENRSFTGRRTVFIEITLNSVLYTIRATLIDAFRD